MARPNELGEWGEEIARDYLRGKGYTVMAENMHVGHKEVDIIALKGDRIIFVEVKTRSSNFLDPVDAVDDKKIRRITRAADSFIRTYDIRHEAQFDIIAIVGTPGGEYTLEHYEDAFRPPLAGAR